MKGISTIICTYNSGDKLVPTLQYLAAQKLMPDIPYEIIIVDNNCTDDTVNTSINAWEEMQTPFPLIVVEEPKAGLNFARKKGIQNAKFEYIIFCDDDNWLCADYFIKVFSIFEKMPNVAIIGGVGEAVSNVPLPKWFYDVNGFGFAVSSEGRHTGFVDSVYGAGMALRKEIFITNIRDTRFLLTDRKGTSLSSGGDTEICMLVKRAGFKIYLDESLTFKHFLPATRLKWKYYLQLRKSFGIATAHLQINENYPLIKSRAIGFLSIAKFSIRNLKYFLFAKFFKEFKCAQFVQELSRRKTILKLSNGTFV